MYPTLGRRYRMPRSGMRTPCTDTSTPSAKVRPRTRNLGSCTGRTLPRTHCSWLSSMSRRTLMFKQLSNNMQAAIDTGNTEWAVGTYGEAKDAWLAKAITHDEFAEIRADFQEA